MFRVDLQDAWCELIELALLLQHPGEMHVQIVFVSAAAVLSRGKSVPLGATPGLASMAITLWATQALALTDGAVPLLEQLPPPLPPPLESQARCCHQPCRTKPRTARWQRRF